ncbi:MAG: Dickkopf N-terminal cysteine-rich domain-containing protein [Polyangiaceae bacterium]
MRSIRRSWVVVLCAAACATLVACGSDHDDASGGASDPNGSDAGADGGSNVEDTRPYCERPDGPYEGVRGVFASYCDAIARCNSARGLGYAFACRQECVQTFLFGASCGLSHSENPRDRFSRHLVNRTVTADPTRAAACSAWLASASCTDVAEFIGGGHAIEASSGSSPEPGIPPACAGVLAISNPEGSSSAGSVPKGGACTSTNQCAKGLYCKSTPPSGGQVFCSVCESLPSAGSPCLDGGCAADAYCDGSGPTPTCRPANLADGTSCSDSRACASQYCRAGSCFTLKSDGTQCAAADECSSGACHLGVCTKRGAPGEMCADDVPCLSDKCLAGTCFKVRAVGESCTANDQCFNTCSPGSNCNSCYKGSCIAPRASGQPCDEAANCVAGSICYQGSCLPKNNLPLGAACTSSNECQYGAARCIGSVCVAAKVNGATCGSAEECASNICNQGHCGYAAGQGCSYATDCYVGLNCANHTCVTPKADGQACIYREDCIGGACVANVCATAKTSGQTCSTTPQCVPDLFCDVAGGSKCATRKANGQACAVDDGCSSGHCDTASGLCGLPSGSTCASDFQCQGYCNGTVCAAKQGPGASCALDKVCLGYCVDTHCVTIKPYGATCNGNAECAGGICEYTGVGFGSGSHCRAAGECLLDKDCQAGEFCSSATYPSKCAAKKADGATCSDKKECQHTCYGGKCVTALPNGASCGSGADCTSGKCKGVCVAPSACFTDGDCAAGQFCDSSSGYNSHCSSPYPNGQGCRDDAQCQSGFCSRSSFTCKVRPAIGDACQSLECPRDAFCSSGKCAVRKGPGEACNPVLGQDAECFAPYLCQGGTCKLMGLECKPAPVGQLCTLLSACADGAYCDLTDHFTCKARAPVGASCAAGPLQAAGLDICVDGAVCQGSTCVAGAAAGASCATQTCDTRHAYCDATSQTCAPLKYAGEACKSDAECIGRCSGDKCNGACRMP